MDHGNDRQEITRRIASLSPEKRALLELALKGRASATPGAQGGRIALSALRRSTTQGVPPDGVFSTLALLPDIVPSFSWLAANVSPSEGEDGLLASAHDELRRALFSSVDLAACKKILEIGCDDGREAIALARRFEEHQFACLALSAEGAEAARSLIHACSLDHRIEVITGEPGPEAPPDAFDLAFGVEALGRAEDRRALLANVTRRLREGGRLVLGDVVLKTALSMPPIERLHIPGQAELIELLSANRFLVVDCIDIAPEVANYLHDPELDNHLARFGWKPEDPRLEVARAFHGVGALLRGGAAAYLLVTAERQSESDPAELSELNRARISTPRRYWELPATWIYRPEWRRQATTPIEQRPPTHALVLADRTGVAEELARSVREAGGACTLVYRGDSFQREEGGAFRLNARSPEDFARLASELAGAPVSHAVHLWGLDVPPPTELTFGQLQEEALDACGSALYLAQALLKEGSASSPSLWLVTRGAEPVLEAEEIAGLAASPLWGLGKAIAYEHPEVNCVRVDLDPSSGTDAAGGLWAEILGGSREDQVALRGGDRYVLRLARARRRAWESAGRLRFNPNASYLITGGLGGLGLLIARWMVSRGARHLVLLGRKRASDVAAEEVRRMRAEGAVVVSLAGVSVDSDLNFVMAEMEKRLPPLRGVIHAATEVDDGILMHQTRERFGRVFSAKVAGGWNLHRWTEERELDFFLMVSSSTSLMGASGQGNHSAATAFLDALAHFRRRSGKPGQSSNWSAWGHSEGEKERELDLRMRKRGLSVMAPGQCLEVLEQMFEGAPAAAGVMPIDWPVFLGRAGGSEISPLFEDFAMSVTPGRAESAVLRELSARVRGGSPDEGKRAVAAYLAERVAKVLELGATLPEPEQTLHELGLDSLMSVELKNLIFKEIKVEVPIQELLLGKTIAELAGSLHEALRTS